MNLRRGGSAENSSADQELATLTGRLLGDTRTRKRYSALTGPDAPWPHRRHYDTDYTYSERVFAGLALGDDPSILTVRRDPWKSGSEPTSWLVERHHLKDEGSEELFVVRAIVRSDVMRLDLIDQDSPGRRMPRLAARLEYVPSDRSPDMRPAQLQYALDFLPPVTYTASSVVDSLLAARNIRVA